MNSNPQPSTKTPLQIDRERVTCLLLINSQLIKKAYSLYANILSNPQHIQQLLPAARTALQDQHSNLSRRVQCNITVLAFINDKYHNKAAAAQPNRLQFPIILSAPQDMPELNNYYRKLQELYPEALHFLKIKIQQMKYQQENGANLQQQQQFQQQQQQQQYQQGIPAPMKHLPANVNDSLSNNSPTINTPTMNSNISQSPKDFPNNGNNNNMNNMIIPPSSRQPSNPQFPATGTFNPQSANMSFQNNNGFNDQPQVPGHPQSQPQQHSSISPQQVLQQMSDNQSSGSLNSNLNALNSGFNNSENTNHNNLDYF